MAMRVAMARVCRSVPVPVPVRVTMAVYTLVSSGFCLRHATVSLVLVGARSFVATGCHLVILWRGRGEEVTVGVMTQVG